MPFSGPSAAAFIAALTSSTVVSRPTVKVRSVAEPVGIGTRSAKPSSLPLSCGSTRRIAFAAPVEVGHDVQRGGAGPAQVLVRAVLQVLVLGVGVDRGHQTLLDADQVVEHLGHRGQAVGGARGVGDDRSASRRSRRRSRP